MSYTPFFYLRIFFLDAYTDKIDKFSTVGVGANGVMFLKLL